jgi:beta-galactosidase
VVDAAGIVCPGAANVLTYTVSGPGAIYGLANGNPSDHTPDKVGLPELGYGGVWARPAFMGLARALVQSAAGKPGSVVLTATSPGLLAGNLTLTTV